MNADKMKKRYTPYPEKELPVGTVIGIIALIILIIAIASVVSNLDNQPAPKKTASAEKVVTVKVYANGYTCAITPFFEKGQTIVITANGKITASTNTRNPLYGYVGPTGWQTDPKLPGRKLDLDPSVPFLALLGYFTDESGKSATTVFYIGREKTIITERAGTEKICFIPNKLSKANTPKDNSGYFTVTIRIVD